MQKSGTGPADTLCAEAEAATALLQILEREQTSLTSTDANLLEGVISEKSLLVARMSELAIQRHRALAAAGFPGNEAGMQSWINATPSASAAASTWEKLLATIKAAKDRNRANGILIGQQMTRTQSALTILQGVNNTGSFYGPDGQAAPKASSRRLVVG